jgi:RNA polymerase sigma factor (TIGR02999 family)
MDSTSGATGVEIGVVPGGPLAGRCGIQREAGVSPTSRSGDVTELLLRLQRGTDPHVVDQLFPLVYDELRRMAAARVARERIGHTLQATALVNEVYLKLVDQTRVDWRNRAQFFAIAARAMRRILIDYARTHSRQKRGGGQIPVTLENIESDPAMRMDDILELDDVLARLAALRPRQAGIVEMRVFGGLGMEEIAGVLGVSAATVDRDWRAARAWLSVEMQP